MPNEKDYVENGVVLTDTFKAAFGVPITNGGANVHEVMKYNTIQYNKIQYNTIQ